MLGDPFLGGRRWATDTMLNEFDLRVQTARDAVGTELRRLGRSGVLGDGRLHVLALDCPTAFEERLGPALCMSACGLLGGTLHAATPSAAAVELARGALGASRGEWAGVEFGGSCDEGRLSLAVEAVLDQSQRLNPDAAMRTLEVLAEMAREFAEGKRTIAEWVARRRWDIEQLEYVKVVCRTKAWSAFVAPLMCGVAIANASEERARLFRRFAVLLGTASFIAREADAPHLGPGRRSLPLLHALHSAEPGLREDLEDALTPPIQPEARELIENTMMVAGSFAYTRTFARHLATRAREALEEACAGFPASKERAFLDAAVQHTLESTASL